ncbi:MAG: hypothetical protein Kow00127_11590 [Bacteroidales bacterium]
MLSGVRIPGRIVAGIFWVVVFCQASASASVTDSLEQLLPQTHAPEIRAELLNKLAFYYRLNDPDKSIAYATESVEISDSIANLRLLQRAKSVLGLGYRYKGDYEKALYQHQSALDIARRLNDSALIATELNRIGIIFKSAGSYRKALKNYHEALAIRRALGDSTGIANLYNNIGNLYRRQRKLDTAMDYYFRTLELRKISSSRQDYSYILNNIGNLYADLGNFKEAEKYYLQSLELKKELHNKYGYYTTLTNLGDAALNMGKTDEAVSRYTEVLNWAEENDNQAEIAMIQTKLGEAFLKTNNLTKARHHFNQALLATGSSNYKPEQIEVRIGISKLLIQNHLYKQALTRLEEALSLTEGEEFTAEKAAIYKLMSEVHEKLGNPVKSLQCYKNHTELVNAVFNTSISDKIQQIELDHIERQYQLERDLLEEQKHSAELSLKQKNIMLLGMIGFSVAVVLLITGLFIRYREKQKANKELADHNRVIREQNLLLSTVMNTIPSPMYYKTLRGEITGCNTAFVQLLGVGEEAITGRSFSSLFDSGTSAIFDEDDRHLLSTEKPYQAEHTLTLPTSGDRYHFIHYMDVIRDSQGNISGILGLLLDITNRLKTEQELEFSRQRLQELNETKDRFFSIIAHDLKNPVAALMGFAELLSDQMEKMSPSEKSETLSHLRQAAENIYKLLQNLLEWSRSQSGVLTPEIAPVNLNELIRNNVSESRILAGRKKIAILEEYDDDCLALCDPQMIETVIRNLLSNAIKFTYDGGIIKVKTKCLGKEISFSVEDSGTGMSNEEVKEIFSADRKHKRSGTRNEPGTGLGLILCKEFVDKSGGTITVKSVLGKGSKFTVILPSVPASEESGNR